MKNVFEPKKYQSCLDYIGKSWDKIIYENSEDKGTIIGLPNQYISPCSDWFAGDMFYWDSYFIILGLTDAGQVSLAKGIVDNFVYLYSRFGIIPSRNRFFNLGISQPPLLTSMALEVYEKTGDKAWLNAVALVAEKELTEYWTSKIGVTEHLTKTGLSRYCDHYILHQTAEQESGWDMTSRFGEKALDYIPVDLNSFLYKYEADLSKIYNILEQKKISIAWAAKAAKRKELIYQFCWSKRRGFFYDYNSRVGWRSLNDSLAGFVPLWAGLVNENDVKKIRSKLRKFEYPGGLVTTEKPRTLKKTFQWDYPNGWAPLQWLVIRGLLNYNCHEDAHRIGKKWLDLNQKVFESTGHFWERYDVVRSKVPNNERYPVQTGFGWTNGVFVRLVNELERLDGRLDR